MLRLMGASPAVGIAVGVVLLVLGLYLSGYVLATAGGFVLIASSVRLVAERRRNRAGNSATTAGDDRPYR